MTAKKTPGRRKVKRKTKSTPKRKAKKPKLNLDEGAPAPQRDDFKRLQAQWYKKLKRSGFDDIECGYEYSEFIKGHSNFIVKKYDKTTDDHYANMRHHAVTFKFKSLQDQRLFEWFSEGMTFRQMEKLYNQRFKPSKSLFWIHTRVKKLEREAVSLKLWEDGDEGIDDELAEVMKNV